MLKSLVLLLVLAVFIAGASAYGGYKLGQKSPTVGDCVNSVLNGDK